jgi:hypothetical protein
LRRHARPIQPAADRRPRQLAESGPTGEKINEERMNKRLL